MSPVRGQHYDIGAVRAANDILKVAAEYLPLRRAGSGRHVGLCPFHQEKTPSFYVSQARQSFKCFGCGASGDVIDLVAQIERVGFQEALAILADRSGIRPGDWTPAERARYAEASSSAANVAQRVADFAHGIEIATGKQLELSECLGSIGIDSTETLAAAHRGLYLLHKSKPEDLVRIWREMCRMDPAAVARMEETGRSDREHAEAVTRGVVALLCAAAHQEVKAA
jgi:hypothetical protein